MCGSILDHGKRKTRKPHRCWGCAELFPKGSTLSFSVSTDMGSVMTAYWCDECSSANLRELGFDGDYCMDFGAIAEAKRELLEDKRWLEARKSKTDPQ